jgi:hypothetical protein
VSDITHVRFLAGVMWTRYSDGVWRSRLGGISQDGKWWYLVRPGIGEVETFETMRQAMWCARRSESAP